MVEPKPLRQVEGLVEVVRRGLPDWARRWGLETITDGSPDFQRSVFAGSSGRVSARVHPAPGATSS